MSSAICFNLDQSKILSSGNGLKYSVSYHRNKMLSKVTTTEVGLTLSQTSPGFYVSAVLAV